MRGSGKLCGFITAIPVNMQVNQVGVPMAEVNFLCVHKKLRVLRSSKWMCPTSPL